MPRKEDNRPGEDAQSAKGIRRETHEENARPAHRRHRGKRRPGGKRHSFGGGTKPPGGTPERLFRRTGIRPRPAGTLGSPGYDSSDLGPRHWITLTRILSEEMEKGLDGAIILHGTDTMAYTSAWLSVALGSVPIPVVLTGSQLTLDYTPEDVLVNLRGAAQVLCAGHPGVWIYFNWKLLPGNRAHKARATHPDAYVPVNGIPVYFSPEWLKDPQGTDAPPRASWSPSPETARLLALPDRDDPLEGALGWHFCAPGCPGNFSGKERVLGLIGLGLNLCSRQKAEAKPESWPRPSPQS